MWPTPRTAACTREAPPPAPSTRAAVGRGEGLEHFPPEAGAHRCGSSARPHCWALAGGAAPERPQQGRTWVRCSPAMLRYRLVTKLFIKRT